MYCKYKQTFPMWNKKKKSLLLYKNKIKKSKTKWNLSSRLSRFPRQPCPHGCQGFICTRHQLSYPSPDNVWFPIPVCFFHAGVPTCFGKMVLKPPSPTLNQAAHQSYWCAAPASLSPEEQCSVPKDTHQHVPGNNCPPSPSSFQHIPFNCHVQAA